MKNISIILSSNSYAAFVVGFAVMTDSMIYTLAIPFLPDLFARRLHVPEDRISHWNALAFEVFALATILSNIVVGYCVDASASKSRSFMMSVVIMVIATIVFFVGTTPAMIIVSRAIQGASTTFTWVIGLAFLIDQVGEGNLGVYVGWTTVGVAIGEIVGPLVGGPIYEHLGHWAAFGVVQSLLLLDISLRIIARDKKVEHTVSQVQEHNAEHDVNEVQQQNADADRTLVDEKSKHNVEEKCNNASKSTQKSVATNLAWNWLGTMLALVVIFIVRCALEVAVPIYLTERYHWTPTSIGIVLLTITLPAVISPVVGKFTSSHGPRWWSIAGFAICGGALISLGLISGSSRSSRIVFVLHLGLIGIALAVLINANQLAISVAAQRYGVAKTEALNSGEKLGRILSRLSSSNMLSGVPVSWATGCLLGPAISSTIAYTEVVGWQILCQVLGGMCFVAAAGNVFLWRNW